MKKVNKLCILCVITSILFVGCNKNRQEKYLNLTKLEKNLYITEVSDYEYGYLTERRYSNIDFIGSGCSAIRKGNFVGRNFDFIYGDVTELIVKTPKKNDRNATIGVTGGFLWFNTELAEGTIPEEKAKILPLCMLDGINDKGVMVEINCVNATDVGGITKHTDTTKITKIPQLEVVRYLLDYSTSAENAIELMRRVDITNDVSHDVLGMSALDFEIHFLIADKDKTYVVEFDNEKPDGEKLIVMEGETIMTNFYIHKKDNMPAHSTGTERYRKLYDNQSTMVDLDSTKAIMESIRYSYSYSIKNDYDPFKVNSYTCYSDHPILPGYGDEINYANMLDHKAEIIQSMVADQLYTSRFLAGEVIENPNNLWCTCHTSCYDILNKSFDIAIYERYSNGYHHITF